MGREKREEMAAGEEEGVRFRVRARGALSAAPLRRGKWRGGALLAVVEERLPTLPFPRTERWKTTSRRSWAGGRLVDWSWGIVGGWAGPFGWSGCLSPYFFLFYSLPFLIFL